jgi:hypothetical protein
MIAAGVLSWLLMDICILAGQALDQIDMIAGIPL